MINDNIKETYKRARKNGQTADYALKNARAWDEAGKQWYSYKINGKIEYNQPSETGPRWVENAANGLRFKGYCDEFGDSTLRGAVYQLPARKGKAQYIAGYVSSDDFGDTGGVRIDFSEIYDDETEAARQANNMSEKVAESEREYNEAWQAGSDYASAGEELATLRKETIELLQAVKKERSRGAAAVICSALMAQIKGELREYTKLKEKRHELVENFNSAWRKDVWPAFNDGAGESVIA